MSTISILETSTGQEETATLQESLKQAGRIYPNEAVILQEIKRVVDERNDLRRRLENANILIEHLKAEKAEALEALEWYAEKVLNCRKITREGDEARHDLDHDGGKRARMALEKARWRDGHRKFPGKILESV